MMRLAAWWRSFSVQGSWTYERMLGVGLAFVMEPLLRSVGRSGNGTKVSRSLGRAASYFNAHPYLVTLGAGALARAEADGAPDDQVDRLKAALVSSLGSVGDRLIWAGWLPVCSAAALVMVATASPLAAVVTFLVAYNVVHVSLRWWGLTVGWRDGLRVAGPLAGPAMRALLGVVGRLAPFAVGVALPVVAEWLVRPFGAVAVPGLALTGLVCVVVGRWVAPTLGGVRIGLMVVGTALAVGALWQ